MTPLTADVEAVALPCACGRDVRPKRSREVVGELVKQAARDVPELLAYIEELEELWHGAERRGNVWRGIASAMGYEPNAHNDVKPTSDWLFSRVAKYRAAILAHNTALLSEIARVRERLAQMADKQADQRGDYLYRGQPDEALLIAIRELDALAAITPPGER